MKFWNWVQEEGETRLRIDGPIADDQIWGDEVTAAMFRMELEKHPGDIAIYINSPGGSVTAASQIYSMLKERAGKSTARIESLAASAASVVAMGCDRVEMARTAYLMIHNAATVAVGDNREMDHAGDVLREVDRGIRQAYMDKTGLSEDEIRELMDAETWLSAATAIEKGFADGYIGKAPAQEPEEPEEPEEDPDEEEKEGAMARLRARLNLVAMI